MTITPGRPLRALLSPEIERFSDPGLSEAYGAYTGLRFARCHQGGYEKDILNEVQRLDPDNPGVAWVRYQFNKDRKGEDKVESSFRRIEDRFTISGDRPVNNVDERSQPDSKDGASGSEQSDHTVTVATADSKTNDYGFHLIESSTPKVDRIHRVNGGWQYVELLLEMYCEIHQDGRAVLNTSQHPFVFDGRLYVELRWESVTTPLIVTLGTYGPWNVPARSLGNEFTQTNMIELGNKASRSLRDSYRGKNIRDMLPKLTSDLLPPPAIDEIGTE